MAEQTKSREEQVLEVIDRVEKGESERSACEAVGIPRSTYRTTALRVITGDQYARALEALAANQVELTEQTIQDMRAGVIDSNMARVEIDTRKWFASKFLPKRYGDRVNQDFTTDGQPIQFMIKRDASDA